MMALLNPDLLTRTRGLAQTLRTAGFGVYDAVIVTDNQPLSSCEWCELDEVAPIELFYDCGSVLACWDCVLAVAIVAASESRDGWFRVEVTGRCAE